MSVVLAAAPDPSARHHLEKTVIDGVEIEDIKKYLSPDSLKKVRETGLKARVWGLVKGRSNDIYWKRLGENDVILFNVGNNYAVYSRVLDTDINNELAKHLWKPSSRTGSYYDRIIFLKDVRQTEIPISRINHLLGYATNFKPSRNVSFVIVQKQRVEKGTSPVFHLRRR
jgi:hypothetical protein